MPSFTRKNFSQCAESRAWQSAHHYMNALTETFQVLRTGVELEENDATNLCLAILVCFPA